MMSILVTFAILAAIVVATYAHCPTSFQPPPCVAQTFLWIERSTVSNGDFSSFIPVTPGPGPISLGELNTFKSTLYDSTGTVVIGKSQGICTLVRFVDDIEFTSQCTFGLYVDGVPLSSIQLAGEFTEKNVTSTDVQAIIGGTGRFAGANGVVIQETVPPTPPSDIIEFRYTVQLLTGFNCNCA